MKVAVIGANGQLGQDVWKEFQARGHTVTPLTHSEIEICDTAQVRSVLADLSPDLVINTAAMLQVDLAEDDPGRAFAVNALGVRNLARQAGQTGFALLEFGTDYVFDGAKGAPYVESDMPHPQGVYAASKLAGEHFVQAYAPKHFVVRVSGIYGTTACRGKQGENFVRTMLRLAKERGQVSVVEDEILTPTFTADIAARLPDLVETQAMPNWPPPTAPTFPPRPGGPPIPCWKMPLSRSWDFATCRIGATD
jgi:dTDP-4-dehydrorhamnose reductase